MACHGKRTVTIRAPKKAELMTGEMGFMKLQYIGNDPEELPGQVTGVLYPFHKVATLFVDRRDAAYLLGPELVEV